MSAIVNSQNVTFAVGGAGNDNLKFSNVLGGADNGPASAQIELDRVVTPVTMSYYQMGVDNEAGNHKNFTLIPTDIGSGYLYAYGNGAIAAQQITIKGNTAFSSSTSGVIFYGNDDWSALSRVKLNSNDSMGDPFTFTVPSKTTIDISYNGVIGTFGESDPMQFTLGLTLDGQSAFVDSAPIVFPGAIVDEHGYGNTSTNFSTTFRYNNTSDNPVTLNLAIDAHTMGSLNEDANWWINEDRLLGRIYDN